MAVFPVRAEELGGAALDPGLSFQTTEDLPDIAWPVGQARAAEALRLCVTARAPGYNAFVMGAPGTGKHALVRAALADAAAAAPTPSDWCYVHDFSEPRRARAIELPPGLGPQLRHDMDRLVEDLSAAIPAAFESAEYRSQVQLLGKDLEERREAALDEIRREAEARGAVLLRTPIGLGLAPAREGQVLGPDGFRALPPEEQARFHRVADELQSRLQERLRALPDLQRQHRERVKALNREVTLAVAGHQLAELRGRYAEQPAVLAHLAAVETDVVEHVREFMAEADEDGDATAQLRQLLARAPTHQRYGVNVLVAHDGAKGAPVVEEELPSMGALVGRVDHQAHLGALVTDFTLVRAGALHRANGGFLVLEARKLLTQPFAWEELKRALRGREVRIDAAERRLGLSTAPLEPAPIPLDVKVVLIGDRLTWHLLSSLDPEFPELFKVEVDLDDERPRTPEAERELCRLVATLARADRLRPLDRGAVERVLREASRTAEDAARLSAAVEPLRDLLREADLAAAAAGHAVISREDVAAAVAAQERRGGRLAGVLRDAMLRGTLVLETGGTRVGQVNGLSVMAAGRTAFGRPSRITAQVRLGRGEVLDIEREVALGGPLHSKGVLILAGYLGGRYCRERPLALAATLVFEQSYAGVEGDSASLAELCALLSAIAEVPVRQGLAVTGSVDQLGRVQAVGGVSTKIEGFFDLCRERGLSGEEGVLVPRANLAQLVLREDVVAAVGAGRFRVLAVETVDDAVEALTGLAPGAGDARGAFPEGSFNGRVAARLEALAAQAAAFSRGEREPSRGQLAPERAATHA